MRRAAASLLFLLALAACSGEADFSDSMPTPVVLSAEEYQADILSLDRLIFAAGAIDEARRAAMGDQFEKLAARVKKGSDSKFLLLESLELRAVAAHARLADGPRALLGVQQNWIRLRNNLFDDRAWFARSAADLASVVTETEARGSSATSGGQAPSPVPDPALGQAAAPPVHPVTALHSNPLEGRWRLAELYGNGKRMHDAELSAAIWTFDEGLLSMEAAGAATHYSYSEVHDEGGNALHVRESDSPSNRPPADGWMIYTLEGNRLRVAFFDGLGERPAGFERTDGKSEPMLTVAILERGP